MKTSPVERDSFVMSDFNCSGTEIFNENKEHQSDFSALVVVQAKTPVTLYHNGGDKEQGVPFTARILPPEGPGLRTAFH